MAHLKLFGTVSSEITSPYVRTSI